MKEKWEIYMDTFKINFELKELEQVALWGQKPKYTLVWINRWMVMD